MLAGLRRWVRRAPALLLLAALMALVILLRRPERLSDAQGTPVRVVDGDSLEIGERMVRIGGIDAVELQQHCRDAAGVDWACGSAAREALRDLVAGGGLNCVSYERDRYGRAVARCGASGVEDIAAQMVRLGWAVSLNGSAYLAEQGEAQRARRGIWQGAFERPADWRKAHPRGGD